MSGKPDYEIPDEMLRTKFNDDIMRLVGCSESTLKRARRARGIPSPKIKRVVDTLDVSEGFDRDRLRDVISRKPTSLVELANLFDVSPMKIEQAVSDMKDKNLLIDVKGDMVLSGVPIPGKEEYASIDFSMFKETEYPFGIVSDTHLCSKYERLDVLNSVYDRYKSAGIETVLHCGNLMDGEGRVNQHEIHTHGVEGQTQYVVDEYPQRKGIMTKYITGECHEGWWVKGQNLNIGQHVEDAARRAGRNDLVYLGHMEYDIWFEQPDGRSRLRIVHPGGGSSYADSYSSQKYLESLQEGEKPDVIAGGHTHKHNLTDARGVPYWQVGCTQDQTPFMRGRKIKARVGAGILWLKQNELGVFTSIKWEWWPYYDKKFYAYHWIKA